MVWRDVTLGDLLAAAGLELSSTAFVIAHCDGGYTTNLPVADLVGDEAMVTTQFDGEPLTAAHGGPARLLEPHLYFWKSAKWVRVLRFVDADRPDVWKGQSYHIYGDPWREQRNTGNA